LAEGRWNLAPAPLIERLARLEVPPPLALIPRRSARRMNSALRDLAPTTGKLQDSEALVHPADALTAGVADGERVRVTSATGTLEATLRTSEEIARGAISIPHGLTAPNVGSLTTGRAGGVDSLSGMVIQSGIEVRLESARLPQRVVAFSPRSDRADAGSVTDSKHLIDGRTLTTRQGSTDPSREGR
jgi:formate dehydrogenase